MYSRSAAILGTAPDPPGAWPLPPCSRAHSRATLELAPGFVNLDLTATVRIEDNVLSIVGEPRIILIIGVQFRGGLRNRERIRHRFAGRVEKRVQSTQAL